jgi:hypothetical protein
MNREAYHIVLLVHNRFGLRAVLEQNSRRMEQR